MTNITLELYVHVGKVRFSTERIKVPRSDTNSTEDTCNSLSQWNKLKKDKNLSFSRNYEWISLRGKRVMTIGNFRYHNIVKNITIYIKIKLLFRQNFYKTKCKVPCKISMDRKSFPQKCPIASSFKRCLDSCLVHKIYPSTIRAMKNILK